MLPFFQIPVQERRYCLLVILLEEILLSQQIRHAAFFSNPCLILFFTGSTGEKILFVGDSAGGNLVITTAMKLKQLGIKLPHSIFPFYPTTIVRSSVTPSRFLSLLDPLLPIGVLYSCL